MVLKFQKDFLSLSFAKKRQRSSKFCCFENSVVYKYGLLSVCLYKT